MYVHKTWTEIDNWIERMGIKHGKVVYDKRTFKPLDWGQALCRELYGHDWMNSPAYQAASYGEHGQPAPPQALQRAYSWEAGQWPAWVGHTEEQVLGHYLPFKEKFPFADLLNYSTGTQTLSSFLVDVTWVRLKISMRCDERYKIIDDLGGDIVETSVVPAFTPGGAHVSVIISEKFGE